MNGDTSYGYSVAVDAAFDPCVAGIRELLKAEGFGILCEIDVTRTLKEKAGVDFRPYLILGACNPQLAHRALSAEAQLGLLLPCNVVVQRDGERTVVSAIDAEKMLDLVANPHVAEVAKDANARLHRVIDALRAQATQ